MNNTAKQYAYLFGLKISGDTCLSNAHDKIRNNGLEPSQDLSFKFLSAGFFKACVTSVTSEDTLLHTVVKESFWFKNNSKLSIFVIRVFW